MRALIVNADDLGLASGVNDGIVEASTIQVAAIPLRQAAAQAREILLRRASDRLGLPIAGLVVENGVIRTHG